MAALTAATPAIASAPTGGDVSPSTRPVACRKGSVEIHHRTGTHCYVERGLRNVAIYGVNRINPGDNMVKIQFQSDQNSRKLQERTMQAWQEWSPGHIYKVTRIQIYQK